MAKEDYDETLEQEEESRPGFFRRLIRTIILLVVLIALSFGGWTLYSYSEQSGKKPWQWDGAQWKGWWAYTVSLGQVVSTEVGQKAQEAGHKAVEYGGKAIDKVKAVEWSKLGNTISEKTKSLFGKSDEVVQKIEQNRGKTDSGYEQKYPGEAGQAYDYGLVAMEEGIRFWKVSLVEGANEQRLDPKATEKAVKKFKLAVANFEQAKQLQADLSPDLDGFLQQAKDYLDESTERQQKIEEILKTQPAGAAPAGDGAAAPAEEAAATPAAEGQPQ